MKSKLSIGSTQSGLLFSIMITPNVPKTWIPSMANFSASVVVAKPDGEVVASFKECGNTDWALANACHKRISTGEFS